MIRLKMFAYAQLFALICVALIVFFKWEPLVGIGMYGAALVSTMTGILWLMLGPDDLPSTESPDLSQKAINESMRLKGLEIYKDHLEGKHEQGTMLHQICEISLEPAKMHAAFMDKYGKPMNDPSMGEIKMAWEDSWIKYKSQAENSGMFDGLTYDQAGNWRRAVNR